MVNNNWRTKQCAPLFSPLHPKVGCLLFLTDISYSDTVLKGGGGGGRGGGGGWKLNFPLLKSAKHHKVPLRQSGSTNFLVDCWWTDYADCKENLFPRCYSRLWLFIVYVCKYEGLLVRIILCCIDLSHFHWTRQRVWLLIWSDTSRKPCLLTIGKNVA